MRVGFRTGYALNESASLVVATGAPDDYRRLLAPGGGDLRKQAEIALADQDAWSDDHHRGFWQALEPLWPRRRGTVSTRERLDALAGFLLTVASVGDWSRSDVAGILGVASDSLRRTGYGLGDRKTRWWPGTGDHRLRLPRVYRWAEPEPDGHPAVAVSPPHAPALEYVEGAARSALERATASGPTPRIIAVFGLSHGSVSTLMRDEAAGIFAVTESTGGWIAYDPIRVALGLEWLDAPPPASGGWEEVKSDAGPTE